MGKYGAEITKEICDSLESGNGRIKTAKIAGIHYSTFLDWMKKHSEFSDAVKKAEKAGRQEVRDTMLDRIRKHSEKSWQAAAWILERMFPDEFALKREAGKDDGHRIEVVVKSDKNPEMSTSARALRAQKGGAALKS